MPMNILLVKEMLDKLNVREISNITDTLNSYLTYLETNLIDKIKEQYSEDINVFLLNILYEYNNEFLVPKNKLERYILLEDTISFLKDNIEDYNLDFIHFEYKLDEYLSPFYRLLYDNLSKDIIINSTDLLLDLNLNIDFNTFDLNNINEFKQLYMYLYKDLEKYMLENKIYLRLIVELNKDIKVYDEYIDQYGMYYIENNRMELYAINTGVLEKLYINSYYGFYNFELNETVNIYLLVNQSYSHKNYSLLTLEEKIDNLTSNLNNYLLNDFNLLNINYCYDFENRSYSLYINLKDNLNFIYDDNMNNIISFDSDIDIYDLLLLEKNKISYWYKNGLNTNYKISYNFFNLEIKHRQFVYSLNHMFKNLRTIINNEKLLGLTDYNKLSIERSFNEFLDDMIDKFLILDYKLKIERIEDSLKFEVIMYSNRLSSKMYKAEN